MKKKFKNILLTCFIFTSGLGAANAEQTLGQDTILRTPDIQDSIDMKDPINGKKRRLKIQLPDKEGSMIFLEPDTTIMPFDEGSNGESHRVSKSKSSSRPIFGLTFSRIDFGLTRPMQDGGFKMEGENEIFNYRPSKTWNFGFDVFQVGYRFNKTFRTFLSAGFDWTYYRLNQDYIFDPEGNPYVDKALRPEGLRRNKLTSTYLRLPLTFEFRSSNNSGWGRTRFAFGPVGGFLLKGTQRYKLDDGKKIKDKGDYDFTPFQYGAFARFGVGSLGIYGKYYFNEIFANAPENAGMNNFTFGLTLGF